LASSAAEALDVYPALAESRDRLLRAVRTNEPSTTEMIRAVECDPSLTIAVLRLANQCTQSLPAKSVSIRRAIELLGPAAIEALAARTEIFDFFERSKTWDFAPHRFRLHAVAVQRVADRIARAIAHPD